MLGGAVVGTGGAPGAGCWLAFTGDETVETMAWVGSIVAGDSVP
jgi:hypothetical protein